MIPELRTSRRLALSLTAGAVAAIAISVFGAGRLERGLESEAGAVAVLGLWCVAGVAGAITGIVDAYVKPEGERLELATKVLATLFTLLALVVVTGIVVGATGGLAGDSEVQRAALALGARSSTA